MLEGELRKKKCKACSQYFEPQKPLQAVCGLSCAILHGRQLRQDKIKREVREARKKLRSEDKGFWKLKAQRRFNDFIRERDKDLPCISCGEFNREGFHAGHYISVGANCSLRFEEMNVHKQCSHCNTHKSGNATLYRVRLLQRIGASNVEWLEGPHPRKNYRLEDFKEIYRIYSEKLKELKSGAEV